MFVRLISSMFFPLYSPGRTHVFVRFQRGCSFQLIIHHQSATGGFNIKCRIGTCGFIEYVLTSYTSDATVSLP